MLDYGVHDTVRDNFAKLVGEKFRRAVASHAPGIRTFIAVKNALVVAGTNHRAGGVGVGKSESTEFTSFKEFFDYHRITRLTECFLQHDLIQRRKGLLRIFGDEDAFTLGQPVGFDNQRKGRSVYEINGVFINGKGDAPDGAGQSNGLSLPLIDLSFLKDP